MSISLTFEEQVLTEFHGNDKLKSKRILNFRATPSSPQMITQIEKIARLRYFSGS